jgi:hypothetical protein
MCAHCAREVESDIKPFRCNGPIDREAWAKLPIRAPAERMVSRDADGKEICIGTMHPIEEYA